MIKIKKTVYNYISIIILQLKKIKFGKIFETFQADEEDDEDGWQHGNDIEKRNLRPRKSHGAILEMVR